MNANAIRKLRVGHKQSGYGYHSGVDGFHQFSIPKTLVFHEVSTNKVRKNLMRRSLEVCRLVLSIFFVW